MTRPGPPAGWLRRAGFASAVLACVALPALVAGGSIDLPAQPGELERLAAAYDGSIGSELARQFELAMLQPFPAEWPEEPTAKLRLLSAARLMQMLAIFALAALLYLATLLARGRLPALVTVVALALLPAVFDVGYVLRPETAAVMFALLGLLLLELMVHAVHQGHGRGHGHGRGRGPRRRAVVLMLLATSAALALGLAIGTLPTMGGVLLLPIALFMLATLQLTLRGLRVGMRRTVFAWPAHAITRRLWPVALAALLAPAAAVVCMLGSLTVSSDRVLGSAVGSGVLPAGAFGGAVVATFAALGALALVLRIGIPFGRRGRIGPGVVLLIYVATQLIYAFDTTDRFDPLPSAPAVAVLVGEGAFGLVAFVGWLAARSRRRG